MSADLQSSRLKKISEAKLCEYPGTDKLIEKVTFEADSLEVKPDTLKHEALTERDLLLSSLSEETKMALLKLGKRTRPEIMKDLIREICSQSELSLEEICLILERKSKVTIYNAYITPLLNEKKLIKTNPDKPTSPNQKYKTVLSQKEKS